MNVLKFNLNDVLVVELADECFFGELVFRNKTGTQFNLKNVRNLNTNQTIVGTQMFYTREVLNITPLRTDTTNAPEELSTEKGFVVVDKKPPVPYVPLQLHMTPSQLSRITNGIEETLYINQTDRSFHDCMHYLRKQDSFAIGFMTDFKAGVSGVSLITICTLDQRIFMLDILSLGQVPTMLKKLLENRKPRKIVHHCSIVAYILRMNCGIQLNGVFDTMVAHVAVGGDKDLRYIGDVLTAHLSVPGVLLEKENEIDWTSRPVSAKNRTLAAQEVAYLPVLHEYLVHDRMLGEFYRKCEEHANLYDANGDDVEVAYEICSNSNANTQQLAAVSFECDVDLEAMRQSLEMCESKSNGV